MSMLNNVQRDILIMTLQLTITRNAITNGWTVRKINNKQLELTKKWNNNEDYDKICCGFLFRGNKIFSE